MRVSVVAWIFSLFLLLSHAQAMEAVSLISEAWVKGSKVVRAAFAGVLKKEPLASEEAGGSGDNEDEEEEDEDEDKGLQRGLELSQGTAHAFLGASQSFEPDAAAASGMSSSAFFGNALGSRSGSSRPRPHSGGSAQRGRSAQPARAELAPRSGLARVWRPAPPPPTPGRPWLYRCPGLGGRGTPQRRTAARRPLRQHCRRH